MAKIINTSDYTSNPPVLGTTGYAISSTEVVLGLVSGHLNTVALDKYIIDNATEEDFLLSGCFIKITGKTGNLITCDLAKKNSDNSYPEATLAIGVITTPLLESLSTVYKTADSLKVGANKIAKGSYFNSPSVVFNSTGLNDNAIDVIVKAGENISAGDDLMVSDDGLKAMIRTGSRKIIGKALESAKSGNPIKIKFYR
jgi:hypothetical protein